MKNNIPVGYHFIINGYNPTGHDDFTNIYYGLNRFDANFLNELCNKFNPAKDDDLDDHVKWYEDDLEKMFIDIYKHHPSEKFINYYNYHNGSMGSLIARILFNELGYTSSPDDSYRFIIDSVKIYYIPDMVIDVTDEFK